MSYIYHNKKENEIPLAQTTSFLRKRQKNQLSNHILHLKNSRIAKPDSISKQIQIKYPESLFVLMVSAIDTSSGSSPRFLAIIVAASDI